MEENLKYIKESCIEWNELCAISNISSSQLSQLIANKVLPEPSYTIESETVISSSLNDSHIINTSDKYFARSTVGLVSALQNELKPIEVKKEFRRKMLEALENAKEKHFAYGNILNHNNEVDLEQFENVFEEEWTYFMKGVYGICTLNASEEEIVKKEIAVKKLIEFNNKFCNQDLSDTNKQTLRQLGREFNDVTSLFAPYQRDTSSRGKYLDEISKQNEMYDLIKGYSH